MIRSARFLNQIVIKARSRSEVAELKRSAKDSVITFCTGYPPDGQSVMFADSGTNVSDEELRELDGVCAKGGAECYLVLGVNKETKRLLIRSLSAAARIDYSATDRIFLQPTLPAKGPGMLEVRLHRKAQSYPDGILWSSRHTDSLHMWLRDLTIRLSDLMNIEFEQLSEFRDC